MEQRAAQTTPTVLEHRPPSMPWLPVPPVLPLAAGEREVPPPAGQATCRYARGAGALVAASWRRLSGGGGFGRQRPRVRLVELIKAECSCARERREAKRSAKRGCGPIAAQPLERRVLHAEAGAGAKEGAGVRTAMDG